MMLSMGLCECGCGNRVNSGKHYVRGHNWVGKRHNEHSLIKMSMVKLGKLFTEEHKLNLSLSHKGKVSPHLGKHHTECVKAMLREKAKLQWVNAKNNHTPMGIMGRHHSDEAKRKITLSHVGKCSGELNGFYGKRHSEETLNILRKTHLGKSLGENNGNWLGGKSFEPYTKEFNKQIRVLIKVRDAYTCQLCGIPERETYRTLPIHHIDYNKGNSLPTNLICLCPSCNSKVNYNREYWTDYFRKLLNQRQLNHSSFVRKKIIITSPELGILP